MARLTITLSDERHQALKETAASSGKTIGQIIDESLDAYGIKTHLQAEALVAGARRRAKLDDNAALSLALEETGKQRRGR